jgi:hypothetical protein
MDFIIVGIICFSGMDVSRLCLPFEENPIVHYTSVEKCYKETKVIDKQLRKEFLKDKLVVDELIVTCVENPYKKDKAI